MQAIAEGAASVSTSWPIPRRKEKRRGGPCPARRRAAIARNRPPCSRSIASIAGNAAGRESTRLSPAVIPDTAVSTSVSAASAPTRRQANSWTVSS